MTMEIPVRKENEDQREDQPGTLSLWPEAGRILGLSKNGTYAAAQRGEIPTIRFGRKYRVSRIALARLLSGVHEDAQAT